MPAKHPHKKPRPRKSHRRRAPSRPAAPRAATPDEAISAVLDALVAPLLEPSPSPPAEPTNLPLRGEEHRAHERVVLAVAVGLGTESHFFAGLSGDVSKGGVFVQTYRDIPVGSDVEVLFDLPDGQLRTHGRVRWHRDSSDSSPPGVGIAFEELRTDDWRLIQRFCERRPPLYYDLESA